MKVAVILAAGRGSRINKITRNKPKSLIKLWGKTLLERHIEILTKYKSIKKIYIITGYKKKLIEEISYNYKNVITVNNKDWNKSNMVTSLTKMKKYNFNSILIIYGDIFYPKKFIDPIFNKKYSLSLLYDAKWINLWKMRFKNYWEDAESFILNKDKTIRSIGEKINKNHKPEGQFIGIIKMNKKGWNNFLNVYSSLEKNKQYKIDFTSFLNLLINKKNKIFGIKSLLSWGEIDNLNDLYTYKKKFSKKYFEIE